ncbi:aminofutalosine synthase MqnE [Halodesulfovibrio spirochaetisodalis]|uniref:Aminodeoxyfutalosine synthase n=1 Tax=Halodesulfovibrio spirochaetisodalis TaxID=1560234 RepID=A0A1B7XB52_9BACT|nr:aminofutalosine synthase MqnE [Halodesulfovibrio spirochaetisodalis]OBQ46566.1 radical SAM protein [Halodesulfovibrio spirochaetisodalis]
MLDAGYYARLGLGSVFEKVMNGERLSIEDGRKLFACEDINALGALAHHARTCMHGDSAYYVLNRHVNYTNVCVNACLFCAYQKEQDEQEGAFRLSIDDIVAKLDPQDGLPYDEVHIVGGCHPKLPLSFFEEAISRIKETYPGIVVKAFTAVEIAHFAELENCTTQEVLERLKAAGLEAMPGGGAEIFAPEVREKICPRKATGEEWLNVAREAHKLGITSNCTMLFGHLESIDDRLDHLDKLRRLQDETNGFSCFIPLPFLTENSMLELPEERKGKHTGLDKLRTIAVSRLMLDNIPHIKAYWVMLGVKLAQAALHYGADDLDGTIVEEKIGHDAGAQSDQAMTIPQLEEMISRSGFNPVRRNSFFKPVTDKQEA